MRRFGLPLLLACSLLAAGAVTATADEQVPPATAPQAAPVAPPIPTTPSPAPVEEVIAPTAPVVEAPAVVPTPEQVPATVAPLEQVAAPVVQAPVAPTTPVAPASTPATSAPPATERSPRSADASEPRARSSSRRPDDDANASSHGGFDECHGTNDVDACQQELSELFDRQQEACTFGESDRSEACREASAAFQSRSICINEDDPEGCEQRVRDNTCFQAPSSRACLRFLSARRVRSCRFNDPSFSCQLVSGAIQMYCGPGGGLPAGDEERCRAGGGSEEEEGPRGREGGGGGGAQRIGLTDPGARGDVALARISTVSRDRDGDDDGDREPTRLASTGQDSWFPALVGLLLLAAGALMHRRFRVRSGSA